MKKILLASIFTMGTFFFNLNALAEDNYENMCSQIKPKKNFSGTLSSLTGINAVSRNAIEGQIEKAIKKETNSKFNVKINNFWGINPVSGKFASLSAMGKDFEYKNFFFTSLKAQTLCPYNDISYKNNDIQFNENMILKYTAEIDEKDLSKTVSKIQDKIMKDIIEKDKLASSFIEIKNTNAKIKNDKINIEFEIVPFSKFNLGDITKKAIKPAKISFTTGLKAQDGKISFANFESKPSKKMQMAEKFVDFLNSLNVLSYNVNADKNSKGELRVEDVKIKNSKIQLSGYFIIPKEETK